MKTTRNMLVYMFFSVLVFLAHFNINAENVFGQSGNSIIGIVSSPEGRSVAQVYVQLLNEVNSVIARTRTDDGGRFIFSNLSTGTFTVSILVSGTNYLEYSEEVRLGNYSAIVGGRAPDNQYIDIKLKYDKKRLITGVEGTTGVVFLQDVPEPARRLFEKGVADISNNKESGLELIKKSLEIYPTYFMALNRLGIEYVQRGQNEIALPFLIKSIDVNQRSFSSYYALGIACYKLNHKKEALEALRAATTLNGQSAVAYLWYGMALKDGGALPEAEKSFIKAKELAKKTPIAEIHYQLALIFNRSNRNKEAADELDIYLKLQPDTPEREKIKALIAQLRNSGKQ